MWGTACNVYRQLRRFLFLFVFERANAFPNTFRATLSCAFTVIVNIFASFSLMRISSRMVLGSSVGRPIFLVGITRLLSTDKSIIYLLPTKVNSFIPTFPKGFANLSGIRRGEQCSPVGVTVLGHCYIKSRAEQSPAPTSYVGLRTKKGTANKQ